MTKKELTHVDAAGKASMVDVTEKEITFRRARAQCVVHTTLDVRDVLASAGPLEALSTARLVGIQAAKQTSNLVPLCHPLNMDDIQVDVLALEQRVEITATVAASHRTGVEMEALTACAFAAVSVVHSLLDFDPATWMDDLVLLEKSGGRSGNWGRDVPTRVGPSS